MVWMGTDYIIEGSCYIYIYIYIFVLGGGGGEEIGKRSRSISRIVIDFFSSISRNLVYLRTKTPHPN